MEDVLNEDIQKEFGTEWEDLTNNAEKTKISNESNEDSPSPEHLKVLLDSFGHKKFRPMQWKIINSIINHNRDNCAIMTTGYGKSLCYQFPSTYVGGITLVISPLISLMEDQILSLKVANIPACLLGTANQQQKKTIEGILENKFSLIYLTPEFCTGELGKELLAQWYKQLSITLIAVDEAHCVSSWGHDFRYQYRNLGILRRMMPDVPILAVTATATHKVRSDIISVLHLRNPLISCSGFDRPNFYFSVDAKGPNVFSDILKVMAQDSNENKFNGSTIIYCVTRKNTELISEILQAKGIKCLAYHAGLPMQVRKDVHEKFVKDKVNVVVATIAFGMGIDKPDVRNVIHYGISSSLEGYYQEAGRAGRDGLPAKCIVFYSEQDFTMHRMLREQSNPSESTRQKKEQMIQVVRNYLNTRQCRRQFILSYFEENENITVPKRPNCCDNCARSELQSDTETYEGLDENGKLNYTEDAKILLAGVNAMGSRFGMGNYILFLRGSKSSKVSKYVTHPLHGSGKEKTDLWWKGIGALLMKNKLLATDVSNTYTIIKVTKEGKKFLDKGGPDLIDFPTPEMFPCLKRKGNIWLGKLENVPSTSSNTLRPEENEGGHQKDRKLKLYKLLLDKRVELANAENCMPYMVASNKALMDIAEMVPLSLQRLRECQLEGFTEVKLAKFGEEFIKVVRLALHLDDKQAKSSIKDILTTHPLQGSSKIGNSAVMTYSLFERGLTVEDVAKERNISSNTVYGHLNDCMKLGYPIKLADLGVTYDVGNTIVQAIKKTELGLSLLSPIKMACPEEITYNQVRAVVNYLQIREHLRSLYLPYEEFEYLDLYTIFKSKEEICKPKVDEGGNLTQFIQALNDIVTDPSENSPKLEEKPCNKEPDANFASDNDDDILVAACNALEASFNETNSNSDCRLLLDDDDAPKLKRSKPDPNYSVLDSPPRQSQSQNKLYSDSKDKLPSPNRSKGDSLNLPPWLTAKRIA